MTEIRWWIVHVELQQTIIVRFVYNQKHYLSKILIWHYDSLPSLSLLERIKTDAWVKNIFVLNKEGMDWCKNLLNKLKMEREAADGYFVRVCNNGDTFVTNCLRVSKNDH